MKIKITRPDGSVIEATGTPKQCAEIAAALAEKPVYVPSCWPYFQLTPNATTQTISIGSLSGGTYSHTYQSLGRELRAALDAS